MILVDIPESKHFSAVLQEPGAEKMIVLIITYCSVDGASKDSHCVARTITNVASSDLL